jgi:hypothetical protein
MQKKLMEKEQKKRLLVLGKETLRKLAVTGGGRLHIPVPHSDDTLACESNTCSG